MISPIGLQSAEDFLSLGGDDSCFYPLLPPCSIQVDMIPGRGWVELVLVMGHHYPCLGQDVLPFSYRDLHDLLWGKLQIPELLPNVLVFAYGSIKSTQHFFLIPEIISGHLVLDILILQSKKNHFLFKIIIFCFFLYFES